MTHVPPNGPDSLPDGTHVGRIALLVADLDGLTDFYQDVVGLTVLERPGATATLGVDGTPLLVLVGDEDAPERQRTAAGLFHTAFRVPSRGSLGDALGRIRDHWRLDGASDHRVSEALYCTDPEGNGVEIYRDFPREAWPVGEDGRVLMGTDRLDLASLVADAAGDDRAPPGTDVGHVHLEVSSLEAFEEFYVDALGFEEQMTVPAARFVSAGGYHHHVGANTWHERTTPAQGRGLSWFEVILPDESALAAAGRRLSDRGVAITETAEGITTTDPDGIEIRLRVGTPR